MDSPPQFYILLYSTHYLTLMYFMIISRQAMTYSPRLSLVTVVHNKHIEIT